MSADDELVLDRVTVRFGALRAVNEVSLRVTRGETVGLIGPNGAGKTTVLNAASGFQRVASGSIRLDGREMRRWSPQRRARTGVVRTFQAVRLFPELSVRENIEVAGLGSGLRPGRAAATADELIALLNLQPFAERPAAALPYGPERRVGIARCLAARPRFLLLDEPVAGMNEEETDELLHVLREVRASLGCALIVVEHDMRFVLALCSRVQVLDHGVTIFTGAPEAVTQDPGVRTAYLGSTATGGPGATAATEVAGDAAR